MEDPKKFRQLREVADQPEAFWHDPRAPRRARTEREIMACIPSKSNRKTPIEHDRELRRQRHKIENALGRLKDWRRIHTRYHRWHRSRWHLLALINES